MEESVVRAQLAHSLGETEFGGLGERYRGKVRDTYRQGDRLIIVTTDRISAFDHVLGTIPFKGEILNRTAAFWFEQTRDLAPNHVLDIPDPNVTVARVCEPLPIEFVVRGYLTGSLWRDYQAGKGGTEYGLRLPAGMKRDQRFDVPLLTPTTKAEQGLHDQPISREAILTSGLVSKPVLERAYELSLALFARGQQRSNERGLILVDTKYEFGMAGGELLVIDEIHTMDSSRYWERSGYGMRFARGEDQKMLDKENVRQWLLRERGYGGEGEPPALTDDVRAEASLIYGNAFQRITGQRLKLQVGDPRPRIERALKARGFL